MNPSIPETQMAVQLVGPGELALNIGKAVPRPGPTQILARTEAVGLCFSDMKLLKQFGDHVRKGGVASGVSAEILADMPGYVPGDLPTVPGHEAVCRVVAVGEDVRCHAVGDRFIIQPEFRTLPTAGSNAAFGYNFEGALQEYILLDERIVCGADGDSLYTIPVPEDVSAVSVALVEPWACVENSYVQQERRTIKDSGRLLVVADAGHVVEGLAESFAPKGPPATITSIAGNAAPDIAALPDEAFDDIVYFGSSRRVIEALNDKLAAGGIINIVLGGHRIVERVSVGLGRVHYGPTRWIGTAGSNAADAYMMIPQDGELRPGDKVLVIGAGGPMGQMHVIRALSSGIAELAVTATDNHPKRLAGLRQKAEPLAESRGLRFEASLSDDIAPDRRFTYYAVMAPVAALVADAIDRCEPNAIVNIFAGIPAPVRHEIDLDALIAKRCFVFGTSGSETEHMRIVLRKVIAGQLDTGASLDAVSGMAGAKDGLRAVEDRTMSGKIVIYPALHDMPLIRLSEMGAHYPAVAAKMEGERWTRAAEDELLRAAGVAGG